LIQTEYTQNGRGKRRDFHKVFTPAPIYSPDGKELNVPISSAMHRPVGSDSPQPSHHYQADDKLNERHGKYIFSNETNGNARFERNFHGNNSRGHSPMSSGVRGNMAGSRNIEESNWRNHEEFEPSGHSPRGGWCGRGRGGRGDHIGSNRGRGRGRGNGSSFQGRFDDPQKPPKSWGVFCIDDYHNIHTDKEDLDTFVDKMIADGKVRGLEFEAPQKVVVKIINDMTDLDLFFEDITRNPEHYKLDLIFFGIPEGNVFLVECYYFSYLNIFFIQNRFQKYEH